MEVTAPAFADWAEIAYAAHPKTLKRPETLENQLRVLLRIWGRRPAEDAVAGEPYHDLTLQAPITDPSWLLKFEAWMEARKVAAGTRNHLRSTLSTLYKIALRSQFRVVSGVSTNPARDLQRECGRTRTTTVTLEDLRAWLTHATTCAWRSPSGRSRRSSGSPRCSRWSGAGTSTSRAGGSRATSTRPTPTADRTWSRSPRSCARCSRRRAGASPSPATWSPTASAG